VKNELRDRLDKVRLAHGMTEYTAPSVINITLETLEAIRAHIIETDPLHQDDARSLEDAIEVAKNYQ